MYFNHYTTNTHHNRKSYENEVSENVLIQMENWYERMKNGEKINIYNNHYCELLYSNTKLAHFSVSIISNGVEYDVVDFVVCLHGRYKKQAIEIIGIDSTINIDFPFIAARIINPEFIDLAIGDFERCISWGFYNSVKKDIRQ